MIAPLVGGFSQACALEASLAIAFVDGHMVQESIRRYDQERAIYASALPAFIHSENGIPNPPEIPVLLRVEEDPEDQDERDQTNHQDFANYFNAIQRN